MLFLHICNLMLFSAGRASSHPQVFPKSSVVQVDSNFTFCCILGPGQRLEYMKYNNILMNTTHIIDQSYAMVVHMQSPSPPSCINVYCNSPLYGTCVYVGCKYKLLVSLPLTNLSS